MGKKLEDLELGVGETSEDDWRRKAQIEVSCSKMDSSKALEGWSTLNQAKTGGFGSFSNFGSKLDTNVGGKVLPAAKSACKLNEKKCISVEASTQTEEGLHLNNFMQGLKNLLESGHYSDVTLNIKGKEFKVHKNILSAHSPVFAAMMLHDTKEKATGIVNIDDIEPEVFSEFLRFLYSGCTQNLNSENVIDLYTVADKYQVTELSRICVAYMLNHISLDTFCDIMAFSLRFQEKKLIEVATKYFLQNSTDIAKTAKWLIFMKENLVAGNELFLKALEFKKQ